jgi:hypothetical protein
MRAAPGTISSAGYRALPGRRETRPDQIGRRETRPDRSGRLGQEPGRSYQEGAILWRLSCSNG